MAGKTMDGPTRGPIAEAKAAELAEHYARILGQQADRRVSAVIRTCLRRLPSRLPIQGRDRRAVEALIERVLRLGEVGSPNLVGASSQIDADIVHRLGEAAGDPRGVYRALRVMLGRTALVARHSRQIWELCLSGLADTSSEVHRALVAETPALYCLPAPDPGKAEPSAAQYADNPPPVKKQPHALPGADPSIELLRALARISDDLTDERLAGAEMDRRRTAAEAELDLLRQALDEERQALEAASRREQETADALAKVRRELDAVRQAQAADAATVRDLFEGNRIPEAATFLATRMLGLNLDEAGQALLSLVQSATAADALGPSSSSSLVAAPTVEAMVEAELSGPTPPPALGPVATPATNPTQPPPPPPRRTRKTERPLTSQAPVLATVGVDRAMSRPDSHLSPSKVGRNSPCPCGSGKKFKRCCGQVMG